MDAGLLFSTDNLFLTLGIAFKSGPVMGSRRTILTSFFFNRWMYKFPALLSNKYQLNFRMFNRYAKIEAPATKFNGTATNPAETMAINIKQEAVLLGDAIAILGSRFNTRVQQGLTYF